MKSLRRQKFPQKTIDRLVDEGVYIIDSTNPNNYRLRVPVEMPDDKYRVVVNRRKFEESINPPKIDDIMPQQQALGVPYDKDVEEYYEASLKPEMREFQDDIEY